MRALAAITILAALAPGRLTTGLCADSALLAWGVDMTAKDDLEILVLPGHESAPERN